ncbi:hypothetical protein BS50DRAFT_31221 [Corynespora cassiicola Philippines]|uniref:Centromere protein X n=1 Tax=Corynespora cassiicola Philippines TaxID=1448308 RepID=A0A2T2PBW9_CORCC|nr:hypothetical protein BS50DRAFT_31221 [Corynespora cassiicola Philippines]
MPPSKPSAAGRRKGPSFNPPRPVKAADKPPPSKRASTATTSRAPATSKAPATAKSAFEMPTLISSSDGEDSDAAERSDADGDELMEDAPSHGRDNNRAPPQPTVQPISPELLSRLLYHNFEDENTQIQRGAMKLVGRYMEVFVQEAIARAQMERGDAAKEGAISDGFLQVEDLEKLTPQLVLDF